MVRLAEDKDLVQIVEIYDEVLEHEGKTVSYTNWQKGLYPTAEYAKQAIKDKTMFVDEENGTLWGSVVLNHIQPNEYNNISWIVQANPEEVIVIHTLCIRPSAFGKGKGKQIMDFCEKFAFENNAKVIRLDTYEGNIPASSMYTKLGYVYSGSTKFHFQNVIWETLKCFEKDL